MRKKLLTLAVVSAFALAGCASGEPGTLPTVATDPAVEALKDAPLDTVYDPTTGKTMSMEEFEAQTQTQEPAEPSEDPAEIAKRAEDMFVKIAITQSVIQESATEPKPAKVIESLRSFCKDGESMKLSETESYNRVMEKVAETYCVQIESD